jgi:hypothetical protein
MAQRFVTEIIGNPDEDDSRALQMLERKARVLRLSEDTKIAATGAKWEVAIHQTLERIHNGKNRGRPRKPRDQDETSHEA